MLKNPDFRLLASGTIFNSVGFQGEQVVASLLLYQLTGSTVWVGVGLALSFLPMLLIGVPAGATADHFDRRRLLPLIEAGMVIAMAGAAWLFWSAEPGMTALLTLLLVTGSLRALHHPVRLSYAHDVLGADKLVGALGLLSVVSRLGQLAGAVVAGSVMERYGPGAAFAVLAAGHVISTILFARLRARGRARDIGEETPTLRENLREYMAEFRKNPVLLRLAMLASLVEIFGFSFATALPELASENLGTNAEGLGLLHGARSVGGLIAGLAIVRAGSLRNYGIPYLSTMIGFGLAILMLSQATNLWFGMVACACIAFCAAANDVLVQSMMQLCVSDHLRGRAMGAWVLALGAGPVGHLELGVIVAWSGAAAGLALNGVALMACGAAVLVFLPRIRKL